MARNFTTDRYPVGRILTGLPYADLLDRRFVEALHRHKDAILPFMLNAAATENGRAALNACCILLELGETVGTKWLIDHLQGADPETRLRALERLAYLRYSADWSGPELPIDKGAVFAAVSPLINSPDKRVHGLAQQVLERLGTAEADAAVFKLISHPNPETRMSVARWLAFRGRDDGALDVVEELLFQNGGKVDLTYNLIRVLENICEEGPEGSRDRACRLAVRYTKANLHRSDVHTGNYVMNCLRGIAAVAPSEEPALLLEVLGSSIGPAYRAGALTRLAKLEGARGLDRLCDALKDEAMRRYAAEALTEQVKGATDGRALRAITDAILTETSPSVIAAMAEAFIAAGGTSRSILRRITEKADSGTQMMVHWLLKGFGPKDLLEGLVRADALEMVDDERLADIEGKWRDDHGAMNVLYALLAAADALAMVMVKGSVFPPDHAQMIEDLATITRGQFAVENVIQQAASDFNVARFDIGFAYQGRAYAIRADNLGRYLDVGAVLTQLNDILKATRRKGRFFQIAEEGEVALIMFASGREFPKVARKFRIPIQTDHDAPRQTSIAYVNQVRQTISGQG